MSLSQERPTNPARLFLKTKSGAIVYYDKESQENVNVPTPFEFIVLDQLATIKGWSDQDESGYWSNEVRRAGEDRLTVRTKNGVKETGIWRDIKGSNHLAGAKYTASVYIAHKAKDGLAIANLALTGAALKAWIEFTQKHRVNKYKIILSGWDDAKKGSVSYKVPIFEAAEMLEEEREEAIALDKELQAYFKEYFNYVPEEQVITEIDGMKELIGADDLDDEEVNLSEIPF
jgi:hypothetical protein